MQKLFAILLCSLLTSFAGASELSSREEIGNQVRSLFTLGLYEDLNILGNEYLSTESRTASGLWHLTLYYVGLANIPKSSVVATDYWKSLQNQAKAWIDMEPELSFAHMFMVDVLITEAWMYRGTGYANTVRKEDWALFRAQVQAADDYLESVAHFKTVDPRWYEKKIMIAKLQDWPQDEFYSLLDEAVDQFPTFYELYFRAFNYLQPKWHGSVDEIETFANYAVEKSTHIEGNGLYARFYWYASQAEFGLALFTESEARWEQMRKGIKDVIAEYPDQWNINNFAVFACLANDADTTANLMKQIEGRPILSVWKTGELYNYCNQL